MIYFHVLLHFLGVLQEHIILEELATLLYEETDKSKLNDLESIEKTVRSLTSDIVSVFRQDRLIVGAFLLRRCYANAKHPYGNLCVLSIF